MNDWRKVKLTDVCKPKQWKTISTSELKEEGFPVYGANGKIGFYNEYTHEKETLLITCRGATCGTINICEPKSYVNGNAMALDNLKEECHLRFLFYFFQKRGFSDVISGSAQPQITGQGLSKVEIPLPDFARQKHIAEVLDKADALRQQNRQLLAHYDELLQSTFIELFGDPVKNPKGWEVRPLVQVCNQITDGTHFSPPSVDFGVPYITAKHVKSYGVDFNIDPTYVSQEEHEKIYERCKPIKGDVLYIKDGATTGVAAINPYNFEFSMLSSLALIKPKTDILINRYLISWLNNGQVKLSLINEFMAGAAIKRFTLQKIKSFKIPVPPLLLQQHFAKIVEHIEVQKEQAKTALDESEALFEGLLAKYFN